MIYTVTFNPAIDYVVHIDDMKNGEVNRCSAENVFCGGKGINVSWVLNELGVKSVALGFLAGFTGKALEDGINEQGIETDFVYLKNGFSRINVKIKSSEETDLNGQGPDIDQASIELLFEKLDMLKSGDTLVLAGSIPSTLPEDIYEKIMAYLQGKGIRFVVDATKDLLVNSLKYKPFLIKPNNHELGEIFSVKISSKDDAIKYARLLQEKGAKNVLVSMASDGAVLLDENGKSHKIGVCKGKVKNSVGAGDSMVAGFIAGYEKTGDYAFALRLGTASGGATALSEGLAEKTLIEGLLETL